jgi:hypothetical protein
MRVFQSVPEPAKQLTPKSVIRPSAPKSGVSPASASLLSELEVREARPLVVELDRQPRAEAEELLHLVGLRERLVLRDRLAHPPERDARTFALERDRHDTGARLELDLPELHRSGEHVRRAEDGCPANGSSVAGVKMRIRACPPASGGRTNTVSE